MNTETQQEITFSSPEEVSFYLVTLGCAKNEVDSDRMRSLLLNAGFSETKDPASVQVVLVNTCSFLAVATERSVEVILDIAEAQSGNAFKAPVVVCGCLPSRYGQDLEPLLPEVAAFVNIDDEDEIVSVVSKVVGLQLPLDAAEASSGRVLRTIEGASAYVKISDGCDRFCSFCAIPYIRGRYHSRPAEQILQEVKALMEGGVKEIVLIGQDTGIWGRDFEEKSSLSWLLKQVAAEVRPYGGWVRVLYLQPEGMTEELIATIRDTEEVLNYIDIPIQHCNERILKRMRRSGSAQQLGELFDHLRAEIPGMVLRTTGMVGFPGETEADFEELCDFIQAQQFDYCSVFAYSPEEGTMACKLDQQVDEDVKLEREQQLRDICEAAGFAQTASHIGEVSDVIIDGIEETDQGMEFIGHAWFQAPDCDGAVHIESGELAVGDKVKVRFTDAFCYELVGELV